MRRRDWWALFTSLVAGMSLAQGGVIVDYTRDAGGSNSQPLNGLAARAAFDLTGTQLTILLENTSTGVPAGFEVSDSLLVSLGFHLPDDVNIFSGNAAVIGPGSHGLGSWSDRAAGAGVGEQWIWTNDFGGDLLETYAQVISTSSGQGGGTVTRFDGGHGTVDGPFGGIAASPVILPVPGNKPAVSESILFTLTLSSGLSDAQLAAVADASIVEFGSDARYLTPSMTPEPAPLLLIVAGAIFRRRR